MYSGIFYGSVELCQQALELLSEDNLFVRSTIAEYLGLAHHVSGNAAAARQAYDEAGIVSNRRNSNFTLLAQQRDNMFVLPARYDMSSSFA